MVLSVVATASARANDFEYFSKGIDFWSEKPDAAPAQKTAPVATETKPVTAPAKEEPKKEGFEWGAYMDPKNKEFEGKYTSGVEKKDGTFLERQGTPWRIKV